MNTYFDMRTKAMKHWFCRHFIAPVLIHILDRCIVRETTLWASDWYIASVMDEGNGSYDAYWKHIKYAQENLMSELCYLRIETQLWKTPRSNDIFTISYFKSELKQKYTRYENKVTQQTDLTTKR